MGPFWKTMRREGMDSISLLIASMHFLNISGLTIEQVRRQISTKFSDNSLDNLLDRFLDFIRDIFNSFEQLIDRFIPIPIQHVLSGFFSVGNCNLFDKIE